MANNSEYNDWYGSILTGAGTKQQSVNEAKEKKLRELSDKKRYKLDNSQQITDFTDGDTVTTQGTYDEASTIQRMAGGVDTAETSHGSHSMTANEQARISSQKPRVAEALGKPVTQVTNQDVFDYGEKEKVRLMVEATTGEAFNDDFDLVSGAKIDGSGYNVPVDVESQGQDAYGRNLASLKAKGTDFNLNQSALDRGAISSEAVRRGTVGQGLDGENVTKAEIAKAMFSQEMKEKSDFDIDEAFNRDNQILEVGKGAASMFATGVTEIADLAADVTTWAAQKIGDITGLEDVSDESLALWGVKRREDGSLNNVAFEDAKEVLNGYLEYDEKFVTADREEAVQDIKDIFNDDSLSTAEKVLEIGEATARHGGIIPGLVADSAAYLALLWFGGGTKLAGATLKQGTVAAKTAGLFGNVAKEGSKVATKHAIKQGTKEGIKAGATHVANLSKTTRGKNLVGHTRQKYITKAITKVGSRDAVLTAAGLPLAMANANQAVEEWRDNNEGKAPSTLQMAGIVGLSTLQTKIDHLADKASFGALKITKDALGKIIKAGGKEASQGLIKTLAKSIGRGTLATAGSTALEGATELTQEAITMYAERFGTEKYKDKELLGFLDDESQGRLAAAGILGAGGGLGMAGAGAVVQTATDTRTPLLDKASNIIANNNATFKMNRAVNRVENAQNKATVDALNNAFSAKPDSTKPLEAINEALATHKKELNINGSENDVVQGRIVANIVTEFARQAVLKEGGLEKVTEIVQQIKSDKKLGKNFDNVTFARDMINTSLEEIVFNVNNEKVGGKKVTEKEILATFEKIEGIVGSLPLTPEETTKVEDFKAQAQVLLRKYHETGSKDIDDVASEFAEIGFLNVKSGTKTKKPVWSHENDIIGDIANGQNPGHNVKELKNFATSRINKLFNKRYLNGKNHSPDFLIAVAKDNEMLTASIAKIESAIDSMDDSEAKTKYKEDIADIKERMAVSKDYIEKMENSETEIKRTDKFATKRQKNFGRKSTETVPNEEFEAEPETTIESDEQVIVDNGPQDSQPTVSKEVMEDVAEFNKNLVKSVSISVGTNAYGLFFSKVPTKSGNRIRLVGYVKTDNRGTTTSTKIPLTENGSYEFFPSKTFFELANNIGKAEDFIFNVKNPYSKAKDTSERQFVLIDGMVYFGADVSRLSGSSKKEFGYMPITSVKYINDAAAKFKEDGVMPKYLKNDIIISMLKHKDLDGFLDFINETTEVEGYKGKVQTINKNDLYSQLFAQKDNISVNTSTNDAESQAEQVKEIYELMKKTPIYDLTIQQYEALTNKIGELGQTLTDPAARRGLGKLYKTASQRFDTVTAEERFKDSTLRKTYDKQRADKRQAEIDAAEKKKKEQTSNKLNKIMNDLKSSLKSKYGYSLVEMDWKSVALDGDNKKVYSNGTDIVVNNAGRMTVLVNINGTNIPFYISTGNGGKKGVATGQWYPFFGIGEDGWLNKTNETDINNYYGSPELKKVSEMLNKELGDIRPEFQEDIQKILSSETISADLNPTSNNTRETKTNLDKNIAETLAKIKEKKKSSKISLTEANTILIPVPPAKTVNSNIVKDEIKNNEYIKKAETHITILGFSAGRKLEEIFKKEPELKDKVEELINKSDFTYTERDEVIRVQRDIEKYIDYKDKSKGTIKEHDEALITRVDMQNVEQFINDLNKLTGENFPMPYPHISIATKGSPLGIAIPSEKWMNEKLNPEVLTETQAEQNVYKDYLIIEKDGEFNIYTPEGEKAGTFISDRAAKGGITKHIKKKATEPEVEATVETEVVTDPQTTEEFLTAYDVVEGQDGQSSFKSEEHYTAVKDRVSLETELTGLKKYSKRMWDNLKTETRNALMTDNAHLYYSEIINDIADIKSMLEKDSKANIELEKEAMYDTLYFISKDKAIDIKKAMNIVNNIKSPKNLIGFIEKEFTPMMEGFLKEAKSTETQERSAKIKKDADLYYGEKVQTDNEIEQTYGELKVARILEHNEAIGGTLNNRVYKSMDAKQRRLFSPKKIQDYAISIFDKFRTPLTSDIQITDLFSVLPESKKKLFFKPDTAIRFTKSKEKLRNMLLLLDTNNVINNSQIAGYMNDGNFLDVNGFELDENNIIRDTGTTGSSRVNALSFLAKTGQAIGADKDNAMSYKLDETTSEIIGFYALKMFNDAYELSLTTKDEDIIDMFGLGVEADAIDIDYGMAVLRQGVIPRSALISAVGKDIYSALGLASNSEIDNDTEEMLISQFGMLAADVLLDAGLFNASEKQIKFEIGDITRSLDGFKFNTFRMNNMEKGSVEHINYNKDQQTELREAVTDFSHLIPNERQVVVSAEPITEVSETVRNADSYQTTEIVREKLEENQAQEWRYNPILNLLSNIKNGTEKGLTNLHKMAGWKDLTSMHPMDIEAQESVNRQIENDFDDMFNTHDTFGQDNGMFLKWDFTKSGRFMVDGNVNPQGSKIFRFVMQIVNGGKANGMVHTFEPDTDADNLRLFKLALAQAFDLGLDKKSDKTVLASLDKVVTFKGSDVTIHNETLQTVVDYINGGKTTADGHAFGQKAMVKLANGGEHMHAIQAAYELAQLVNLKKGETFETALMIEADAITSGMALTLLQIGSKLSQELLQKTGIYTDEVLADLITKYRKAHPGHKELLKDVDPVVVAAIKRYNKKHGTKIKPMNITHGILNEEKWFEDFYTDIGMKVIKVSDQIANGLESEAKKLNKKNKPFGIRSNGALGFILKDVMNDNFMDDAKEYIQSKVRSIAKSPVMVFMYGSSIASIKKKLGHTIGKETLADMVKDPAMANFTYEQLIAPFVSMDAAGEKDWGLYNLGANTSYDELLDYGFQKVYKGKTRAQAQLMMNDPVIFEMAEKYVKLGMALYLSSNQNSKDNQGNFIIQKGSPKFAKYENGELKYESKDKKNKVEVPHTMEHMIITDGMVNNLQLGTDIIHGEAFDSVFTSTFAEANAYRDSVKTVEILTYAIYSNEFKKTLAKVAEGREFVTKKEMRTVLADVVNSGLGHNMPTVDKGLQGLEKNANSATSRTIAGNRSKVTENSEMVRKYVNAMFSENDYHSKKTGGMTEFVNTKTPEDNVRAAPTISIHSIDGASITDALRGMGVLNIYDAFGGGISMEQYNEVTDSYQGDIMSNSMSHSVLAENISKLNDMISSMSAKEQTELFDGLDYEELFKSFQTLSDKPFQHFGGTMERNMPEEDFIRTVNMVNEGRADMFSQNVALNHLYAIDKGLTNYKGTKKDTNMPKKISKKSPLVKFLYRMYDNLEQQVDFQEDAKASHQNSRDEQIKTAEKLFNESQEAEVIKEEKPKDPVDLKTNEKARMYIAGKIKDFVLGKGASAYIATKDALKGSMANKFIGFGAAGSSTNAYRNLYNDKNFKAANTNSYEAGDVVFVSVNGKGKGRVAPTQTIKGKLALKGGYTQIDTALNAGASIIADSKTYLETSGHNIGEKALQAYLEQEGYLYEEISIQVGNNTVSVGKWTKADPKKEEPTPTPEPSDTVGSLEGRDNTTDEIADEIEFDIATKLENELLTYMEMEGYLHEDNNGGLQISGKDKKYAKHISELAQSMAQIVKNANLDMGVKVNRFYTDGRTRGSADLTKNHIDLRFNTDGDSMFGVTDTFMHEMLHVLTNHALNLRPAIRAKIRDVQEQVKAQIDYTAFLPTGVEHTSDDIAIAKELYDYVLEGDEAEFVSYSMTNPYLYNAIADIKVQVDLINEMKGEGNFAKVMNKFIGVFNKIYSMTSALRTNKAQDAMRNLTEDLATIQTEKLAETIASQEENDEKGIFKSLFDIVDKKLLKHNDKINEKLASIASSADVRLRGSTLLEKISEIKGMQAIKQSEFFQDVYSELTESTSDESVYGAYKLFNKVKKIQETDKEKLRTSLDSNLDELLKGTSEAQKKAIKRVLVDTDVTTLSKKKGYGLTKVEELLSDEKVLESEIAKVRALFGNSQDAYDYMEQAQGLGYYMVHGESPVDNQMKNANNIFRKLYKGTENIIRGEVGQDAMVEQIDTLATLYALKYSGKENKELAAEALTTHEDGIKVLLNTFAMHMKKYNDELFETVGRFSDVDNKAKGYTYGEYHESKKMVIVKEEDVKYFEHMKMNVVREVDEFLGEGISEKRYVMIGKNIDSTYNKGMMDIIGFGSTGLTLREMAQQSGQREEEVVATIENMKKNNTGHNAGAKELNIDPKKMTMKLMPKFDLGGNIVDYASEMNHIDKVKYMTLNDDVISTVSNTITNTSAKHSAITSNTKVIDYLLNDSERNYKKNPELFIVIEPSRAKDGFISPTEKQWAIIPQYTKDYISNKTNGSKQLIVRKRLVNDVFGYRSPSLANIGNMKEKHPRFYRAIRTLEKFWMSAVSKFKGIIVTLTSTVVFGNMVSNMFFAMQHGVDPISFAKSTMEGWKLIDRYTDDQKELSKLEILKKGGVKVSQGRIDGLEMKLKKNPMHKFIERGMFSPIVEDINVNQKRDHSDIDKFIDKVSTKIPKPIKGFLDFIYINEGTTIHKTMFKLIQYGDITARYAIKKEMDKQTTSYSGMTRADKSLEAAKKWGKKVGNYSKMTEEEKWGYLDELLVNYGYNENKYLRYFNDIGALMFTKYFLRTPKALIRMMKHNPAMSTIFQGVQYGTGVDVVDPLDTFVDPINAILNRIGNPIDMGAEIITPNIPNLLFDFGDFVDLR